MRSTRATTTALVLALGLGASASARADGELQVRGVYYKERATRVQQPMIDGRFDVGDHGTLQGYLLVDAISSASAVASGGAAFDERRVEGGLGYSHVFGKLTLGATARYSTEPDYRSTFATVRDVYAERPEGASIYGLLGAILSFVPALGPIAGALIAQGFGWRAIFCVLAALMALAGLHAARGWPETRPAARRDGEVRLAAILRSYDFWTYTLGFSAAMGTLTVRTCSTPSSCGDRL